MSTQTFVKKFDELTDAPNAITQVRELVSRLAFSGRLSGSASSDGSSRGWTMRTIDEISRSITPGFACSKSHQIDDGHVHLRTHNISPLGTLNFDLLIRIDPTKVAPGKGSIRRGDVLFNNTNSQELVGKTCLVDQDYNYGFSNHITRIRFADDVDPGYVVHYFTMLRNSGYFARLCSRWINQAGINTSVLRQQRIPLPPLAEQQLIVSKIDELTSLCDRLEVQLRERDASQIRLAEAAVAKFADAPSPENLQWLFHPKYSIDPDALRKTILNLAVRGKLEPQDPTDEPGEILLSRIRLAGVNSGRGSVRTESTGIANEEPYSLPAQWTWTTLGEVQVFTNGYAFKSEDYKTAGVGIIRMGELGANGEIDETNMKYVSKSVADSISGVFRVKPGDLLMGMSGSIGKIAINRSQNEYLLNQRVGRLEPILIEKQYLYAFLRTVEDYYLNISFGMAIKNLSTKQINQTPFPLPPLAEQRRLAAKVDRLLALVDQLEAHLAVCRSTATELMTAMIEELTEARMLSASASPKNALGDGLLEDYFPAGAGVSD